MNFFSPFPDKKIGQVSTTFSARIRQLCTYPLAPYWGRYIINTFFEPFPDKKIGQVSTTFSARIRQLCTYPLAPYWGRYIINTFFEPFPDKKIGRFSTVFACPYFTVHGTRVSMNCTPFVRQYGILSNKWGVLLCQREYRTNDTQRNSRSW